MLKASLIGSIAALILSAAAYGATPNIQLSKVASLFRKGLS